MPAEKLSELFKSDGIHFTAPGLHWTTTRISDTGESHVLATNRA